MKLSLLALLLLVGTTVVSPLEWHVPSQEQAQNFLSWMLKSEVPDYHQTLNSLSVFAYHQLITNDMNSLIIQCKSKGARASGKEVVFFVGIICEKIIHLGFQRPVDATRFQKTSVEQTKLDAEEFKTNTLSLKLKWKNTPDISMLSKIIVPGYVFDLEFYCVGENRKRLAIYRVTNPDNKTHSFCFAVPSTVSNSTEMFLYMGVHHETRIEAFVDLEKYTVRRKVLIIDTWVEGSAGIQEGSPLLARIRQLEAKTKKWLGWLNLSQLEVVALKMVSEDDSKFIVVFKNKEYGLYTTIAGVGIRDGGIMLTFVGVTTEDIDIAKQAIENYFNVAFSDLFRKSNYKTYWGWEIINIHNDLRVNPRNLGLKYVNIPDEKVKNSAPFDIPDGASIYLQILQERKNNHWVAAYEFAGKLFIVYFKLKSTEVLLKYIGPLGTLAEVNALFIKFGNNFPNSSFANGIGVLERGLPQIILDNGRQIFDEVLRAFTPVWRDFLKFEHVKVDGASSAFAPAPFNRNPRIRSEWLCVAFAVDKAVVQNELSIQKLLPDEIKNTIQDMRELIFFVIVQESSDDEFFLELVNPLKPAYKEMVQYLLSCHIQREHFTSQIKPTIRKVLINTDNNRHRQLPPDHKADLKKLMLVGLDLEKY